MIKNDVIGLYSVHLADSDWRIRKEIMWGFSNISCCSSEIIQNLFDCHHLIQNILETTLNDDDAKVNYSFI